MYKLVGMLCILPLCMALLVDANPASVYTAQYGNEGYFSGMSQTKPTINQITQVAKSRLFEIESLDLTFSNGEQRTFERLKPRNFSAVMVVPILDDNSIVLIREYAAGINEYQLGFPKGLVDPGETAEQAANRELQEEAGYGAERLSVMTELTTSPSYMSSRMQIVLAEQLFESKLEGDEPEPIETVVWSLDNLSELLAREDFSDARCVAALFWYKEFKRNG